MGKKYAYGVCIYKREKNDTKILLCKAVSSLSKWGCLKGVKNSTESAYECAQREFREECNIEVNIADFEKYFDQTNQDKDIGIWLVNANRIKNLNEYFFEDTLLYTNLSWENSKVKFFSINELPKIRKKQKSLIFKIKDFLEKTKY